MAGSAKALIQNNVLKTCKSFLDHFQATVS